MAVTRSLSVVFIIFCVKFVYVECDWNEIKRMSDALNDVSSSLINERFSISEANYGIENEFTSNSDNLYELLVTNVSSRIDDYLFEETKNYKFFENEKKLYLAGSTHSMFTLNELSRDESKITNQYHIIRSERIFTFEVLNIFNESEIIVLLSVEIAHGSELIWYKLIDGNFESCGSRRIPQRVERLHYFKYKDQNRLLTMERVNKYSENLYSYIDVFGFIFNGNLSDFWWTQRLPGNEVVDLRICPASSGVMLAVQGHDNIQIYDYSEEASKETSLRMLPIIKSVGLKNFVCFRSGNILYLGTSGSSPTIFTFDKDEFEANQNQIVGEEIAWLQSVPVDTWREEVVLVVQLMNSTVIGFEWQPEGFRRIHLPSSGVDDFDLSRVTVVPKFGFVYDNRIVRIETMLKQLDSPMHREIEELLAVKFALAGIMKEQQQIFDETAKRIDNSYLKNSHITGYWEIKNLTSQNVITMKGVSCANVSVAQKSLQLDDFQSDLLEASSSLEKLQQQLHEVSKNRVRAVPKNVTSITFPGDVVIGDLTVLGTLHSRDLTFEALNDLPVVEIFLDLFDHNDSTIIKGQKQFPSIDAEKLTVASINGRPIEEIIFDKENIRYDSINFENLQKLRIIGDLNVTAINGGNWRELESSVVSKSEPAKIPAKTRINGVMTASHIQVSRLNGLRYPEDYVLHRETDALEIPARKTFKMLRTGSLGNVMTINGVSVDEFILLNKNSDLSEKITFENLEIVGSLFLDGNITGGNIQKSGLLNETTEITSNVTFSRIKVEGKLQIEKVNKKTWDDFRDLVRRDGGPVEISGRKEISSVVIEPRINITSNKINGHHVDEFATLDTEQEFGNVVIKANVTFGELIRGDLKNLEEIFGDESPPLCINKFLTFKVPPIVDKLSAETLNGNTSGAEFIARVNQSLASFVYKNLTAKRLDVKTVTPVKVNGMIYEDFISRRISKTKAQVLTGDYEIDNLNAGMLHAETIDGKSVMDLEDMRRDLDDLYDRIVEGNVSISNLSVTGLISAGTLNGINLTEIYDSETMGTVVFESSARIRDLNISGLLNLNRFSELVNDSVMKTDRNIVVLGEKRMPQIVCEILEISAWNRCPRNLFLDPSNHQYLDGPIVVKGKTIIEGHFYGTSKIGRTVVDDIKKRFEYVTENVFLLNGNFEFTPNVSIENLSLTGTVQKTDFTELYDSLVFLNGEDTSITGSKVFKNSTTFSNLMITEGFNDINLKEFYKTVVLIDRPLLLSEVNCSEDIVIDGNLIVTKKMEAARLMDVDLNELKESAINLMKPEFVPGTITFENAVFASNIRVETLNDVNMNNLIPLKEGKVVSGVLRCVNISVGNLEIAGKVNNEDLATIYRETFQLNGAQNITGNLILSADVNIRRDFDAQRINGIDPLRFVTLYDNETITDDFIFSEKIILNGSLRILDRYNGIDPLTWQQIAVTTKFPFKQIISGLWTVNGNVHLKGYVASSGIVNGTDLRKLVDDLRASDVTAASTVDNKARDLRSMCEDVQALKIPAKRQISKFKFFEKVQVMEFNDSIASIHHFESNNFDYLFVSLENRQLNGFVFTDSRFVERATVDNFGVIDAWITLDYRGSKYFVTVGRTESGNRGNLWRIVKESIENVIDLGDVTGARKIGDYEFIVVADGALFYYSVANISKDSRRNLFSMKNKNGGFVKHGDGDRVLLIDDESIYDFDVNSGNFTAMANVYGTRNVAGVRAGIFGRQFFVYYDEKITEDYLFVATSGQITQTIGAYRAESIVMINFDGFVENFMIYIEDGSRIRIHEYEGVAGFRYRETLQMRADKLVTFKLRRRRLAEKNYLGVVDGNKFTILEAKMYGERIRAEDISCD